MAEQVEQELVVEGAACPGCGEREIDKLAWSQDGDFVRCATCGAWFDPAEEV